MPMHMFDQMMQPPMAGPPGMAGPPQGGQPPDTVELLRAALSYAQAALEAEPDDVDSQQLARVIQGLYQILASRQKEQEAALGVSPAIKSLARAG